MGLKLWLGLVLIGALGCARALSVDPARLTMHKISSEGLRMSSGDHQQHPSSSSTSDQAIEEGLMGTGIAGEDGPARYSGYFKLDRTYDAHMFFFFFEAREDPENAPVILWHTGGPGCSSELAVFYENGPWSITKDLTLQETEYGWDRAAHMIYVDQPINTGFSWSEDDRDRCYDEECVSNDMLDFLEALYAARPDLSGRDFFITGESYAGHYVPAVASRIFQAKKSGELKADIVLKGMAIGNGLTDPSIQYGAYPDYAAENGLIASETRDELNKLYPSCKLGLDICDGLDFAAECIIAVEYCTTTMFAPVMLLNPMMNVYDIRKKCEGPLCYDFSLMDQYLNLPEVRKALGVGDRTWEACNMDVHQDMMADWGHKFDGVLPEMMSAGVRVLIYAGNRDFICNWIGNRRWVDEMKWDQWREWAVAPNVTWEVDGEKAGTVTEVGPLSFLSIDNAGHMVPMDVPKNALDMIYKFTRGESLAGDGQRMVQAMSEMKGAAATVLRMGSRKEGLVKEQ